MSELEHSDLGLAVPNYALIKAGMEIITEHAIILGRITSVSYNSEEKLLDLFFVNSIHPILNIFSSVYRISGVEVVTIGTDRILVPADVILKTIEVKVSIFRSIGWVESLDTKIARKRIYYNLSTIDKKKTYYQLSRIDRADENASDSLVEPLLCGIDPTNWAEDGRDDYIDWDNDNDIWDNNIDPFDRDDDEPPYASVLAPKKPNPNLPPSLMVMDDDDNDWL